MTKQPKPLPWHRGDPALDGTQSSEEGGPSPFQRRYGRGQSGGQVRDDRRVVYDAARDARRGEGAEAEAAPAAEAPAASEEPAVSGAKKRLRDDDDDESEED